MKKRFSVILTVLFFLFAANTVLFAVEIDDKQDKKITGLKASVEDLSGSVSSNKNKISNYSDFSTVSNGISIRLLSYRKRVGVLFIFQELTTEKGSQGYLLVGTEVTIIPRKSI